MAQVYLVIPGAYSSCYRPLLSVVDPLSGSSVSVERCFNAGRDVISLRRASLKAETIRNLITAQSTLRLKKTLQFSDI
jgi:hypothetical protein